VGLEGRHQGVPSAHDLAMEEAVQEEEERYLTPSTTMRVSAPSQLVNRSRHSGLLHEETPSLQWRLHPLTESSRPSQSPSIARLLRCLSIDHHLQAPFLFHRMLSYPIASSTWLLLRHVLAFMSASCRPHDQCLSGVLTSEKRRVLPGQDRMKRIVASLRLVDQQRRTMSRHRRCWFQSILLQSM
jgi:hypothetical protein